MQSAEDDFRSGGAIAVRQLVRFFDLCTEARDRDGIEFARHPRRWKDIGDFHVLDFNVVRRRAREREQAETRQRRDDATALDETGKRQPERIQFGVVRPDTAHRDKSNSFHR